MNPWILAALVFGAIGFIQGAIDESEKEKKAAKKKAKPPVIQSDVPKPPVAPPAPLVE